MHVTSWLIVLFVSPFGPPVATSDTSSEEWQVTISGVAIEFSCPSPAASVVRWDFKSVSSTFSKTVYDKGGPTVKKEFLNRFDVAYNSTSLRSVFYIGNVTRSDAGSYKCININTSATDRIVRLVVLESEPNCSLSKYDNDDGNFFDDNVNITVSCDVCYAGEATINVNCVSSHEHLYANRPIELNPRTVESCRAYTKIYVAQKHIQRSTWTCQLMLMKSAGSLVDAVLHKYSWTSPTVNTRFGPLSTKIKQMQSHSDGVTHNGDRLRCSSDGNPEPTFRWTAGSTSQEGTEFTVDVCKLLDVEKRRHLTATNETLLTVEVMCIARLVKTDSSYMNIQLSVDEANRLCYTVSVPDHKEVAMSTTPVPERFTIALGSTNLMLLVGGVLGLVVLIVVVAGVVIFRYTKRANNVGQKNNEPDVFYNDASGARNSYDMLPDTYCTIPDNTSPSAQCVVNSPLIYGPYEVPNELMQQVIDTAPALPEGQNIRVICDNIPTVLTTIHGEEDAPENNTLNAPYEGLQTQTREVTAGPRPAVYKTLSTIDQTTHTSSDKPASDHSDEFGQDVLEKFEPPVADGLQQQLQLHPLDNVPPTQCANPGYIELVAGPHSPAIDCSRVSPELNSTTV